MDRRYMCTKNRRHLAKPPVFRNAQSLDVALFGAARGAVGRFLARVGGTPVHLGAADHDLPAHEIGPVQFLGRFLGRFERLHLDEAEALRAVGVAVHGDLHVLHRADLGEEIEQVALSRLVGQVADVELGRHDFLRGRIGLGPFLALGTLGTFRAIGTLRAGRPFPILRAAAFRTATGRHDVGPRGLRGAGAGAFLARDPVDEGREGTDFFLRAGVGRRPVGVITVRAMFAGGSAAAASASSATTP
jgi:hypothetical protein